MQDADLRVALHELDHLYDGVAAHQAVGIQYHHVLVVAAPAPEKVRDIAALVVEVEPAPAIKQTRLGAQLLAQSLPGCLLLQPDVGITAVGEDVKIKVLQLTAGLQALVYRLEAQQAARNRFMVDRHHHRRAPERGAGQRRCILAAQQAALVTAQAAQHKASHGNPETQRQPGEQQSK